MLARNKYLLPIILLLAPISGMGIDIYTPSLPHIAVVFAVSHLVVKNTVTMYLIGMVIGQFMAGSLSEVYGRKPILLIGLVMFVLACILAALAHTISILLLARFLQGLAITAPVVLIKAIMVDVYEPHDLKRVMTYFVITWALGPIIAPVIGSYLQTYIGWWSSFIFLAVYAALMMLLVLFLVPETYPDRLAVKFQHIVSQYGQVMSNQQFVLMATCLALSYSIIVVFNVLGPFIIQNGLGYSALQFGHIAFFMGFACLIGSTLNRYLIHKYQLSNIIIYCTLVIGVMNGLAMIFYLHHMGGHLWLIALPVFISIVCVGVVYPNYSSLCLKLFPNMAGTASALLGIIIVIGTVATSCLASFFHTTRSWPLFLLYMLFSMLMLIFYGFIFRSGKHAEG